MLYLLYISNISFKLIKKWDLRKMKCLDCWELNSEINCFFLIKNDKYNDFIIGTKQLYVQTIKIKI